MSWENSKMLRISMLWQNSFLLRILTKLSPEQVMFQDILRQFIRKIITVSNTECVRQSAIIMIRHGGTLCATAQEQG